MKVLTLTWEFPPLITGGMGMACYGIVKGLLQQGAQVNLIMPATKAVHFPLKRPEDADLLPAVFGNPFEAEQTPKSLSGSQLLKLIGNPVSVYLTTGRRAWSHKIMLEQLKKSNPIGRMFEILSDDYYLTRQVRNYTNMAVELGIQMDFDVIHAHDWLAYPAGVLLKKICSRPLVAHIHATEFDRAIGPGDDRIHNIEYIGLQHAERVIAVSNYTARIAVEKYHIDPEKVRIIHNAYSMPEVTNNPIRIFSEPTVLFMGRITVQKGPDYFLEVAKKVLEKEKKVRFIMAGSGDMERQILHRAAYYGLGTKFLAAGFLDRSEVEQVFASSDIFILPSISEPFGIAPLEAMSRGVVAIISKNAGVAEIINNAYKVDFWDVDKMVSIIIDLVKDPEKFRSISQSSRVEVTNLSWNEAVNKIMDIFYELEAAQKCSV